MPAMLLAAGTSVLILGALCPGYWINDDLKIAWLLAGYPGSEGPGPFPLHSSTLMGLVLVPLFQTAGELNWFSILMALTNTASIAVLLYVATFRRGNQLGSALRRAVVLCLSALFILELTYTISAFLAAVSGICLIWLGAQRGREGRVQLILGLALLVLGSLIRFQMLLIAAAVAIPPLLLESDNRRPLMVGLLAGATGILIAHFLGRLYLQSSPDWNAFSAYTEVRQNIHDSHRLFNLHGEIRRIGWSPNDQELFARWFFPDANLYSYDHLRYLERVASPYSSNIGGTLQGWLPLFLDGRNTGYLVLCAGILLYLLSLRLRAEGYLAGAAPGIIAISLNAGLAITYKDPTYVQACTIAAASVIPLILLGREFDEGLSDAGRSIRQLSPGGCLGLTGLILMASSLVLILGTVFQVSEVNTKQRAEYGRIRSDLQALTASGTIPPRSLIVSPAHGLPYEWSEPFILDMPTPAYFDTGWITHSPHYVRTLAGFQIDSLPAALIDRDDVFLMTQEEFTVFLARYYDEHYGIGVRFDSLYEMPNPNAWTDYDGVNLYRVSADH